MATKSKSNTGKGKSTPSTLNKSTTASPARSQTKAKAAAPAATKTSSLKAVAKAAPSKKSSGKAGAPHAAAATHANKQKVHSSMVAKSSAAAVKAVAPKPTPKAVAAKVPAPKAAAPKVAPVTKPAVAPVAKAAPAKPTVAKVAPIQKAAPVINKAAPAVASPVAAKPQPAPVQQAPSAPVGMRPAQPVLGSKSAAPVAAKPAQAPSNEPKKPVGARHGFKTGEWIVYPAHGVGKVVAIDEQEIAGMTLELFVIAFEKDKLTLRVPTGKAQSVGMRKLAEESMVARSLDVLKGRARIKRTMWSRRAQEFDQKINSGDIIAIAEVVRDLFRADNQPEQSYSERQLFEAALDRMAREVAIVEKLDERGAVQRIMDVLHKSAKARKPAEAAPADVAEDAEGDETIAAA